MPSIGEPEPEPVYFEGPDALRAWFDANAGSAGPLWVGFRKVARPGAPVPLTWAQAVDEALCSGWIDGIRKSMPDGTYTIRFTPRRPGSTWSAVNVARVEALNADGRMRPPGLAAFALRSHEQTPIYSYESRDRAAFDAEAEEVFRSDTAAWAFWESMPPSYRQTATYWVVSARRRATRERRLAQLINDCAAGLRIAPLRRPGSSTSS